MSKCSKYCIGQFRTPAVVQELQEVVDDYGGQTTSWVNKLVIYGLVEEGGGSEAFRNDQLRSLNLKRFTTKYTNYIKTTDRLIIRNEAYNIRKVDDLEMRRQFTQLVIERGVIDANG